MIEQTIKFIIDYPKVNQFYHIYSSNEQNFFSNSNIDLSEQLIDVNKSSFFGIKNYLCFTKYKNIGTFKISAYSDKIKTRFYIVA
jgi:hypothetical protein